MRFFSTLIASTLGVLIAFGVMLVLLVIFIVGLAAASGDAAPTVRNGSILVVDLGGALPEVSVEDPFAEAFGGGTPTDLRAYRSALRKAAADERIDGIWLQMRGVSASWAALGEIRDDLVAFKASGKPIIASSDDYVINEADYYVGSVADSVFAAPEAIVEYNGFVLTGEFYANLLDKLDVEPQIVKSGTYKSAVEVYTRTDFSEPNREQYTAILENQARIFRQAVATSRGTTPEALETLADTELIFSATRALEAGLIDGLRYPDQVEAALRVVADTDSTDDLRTVSLKKYATVPDKDAGLDIGGDGQIAVVYASGAIMMGESGFSANPLLGGQTLGSESFDEAMETARENDDIDAVVVRCDSPGGFAPAADAMRRAIELTAEVKPVIISMGNVCASGGYWLATAGDTLVAQPATLTGSIGVFSVFFDASGAFNKIGITYDNVQTSPYADAFSALRPLSASEKTQLEAQNDATYTRFLDLVAGARGMTREEADEVAQGRVWTGEDALRVGLVDVLGDLKESVALAADMAGLEPDAYRLRTLPRPKTFIEELTESMSAQASMWLRPGASVSDELRRLSGLETMHGTTQALWPGNIRVE